MNKYVQQTRFNMQVTTTKQVLRVNCGSILTVTLSSSTSATAALKLYFSVRYGQLIIFYWTGVSCCGWGWLTSLIGYSYSNSVVNIFIEGYIYSSSGYRSCTKDWVCVCFCFVLSGFCCFCFVLFCFVFWSFYFSLVARINHDFWVAIGKEYCIDTAEYVLFVCFFVSKSTVTSSAF